MPKLRSYNRILLLWLLVTIGFAASSARTFAACDMGRQKMAASGHACCVQKKTCNCEVSAQSMAQTLSHTGNCHLSCSCAANPEPVNSAPQVEPLRYYVVAAVPARAGPDLSVASATIILATSSLMPVAYNRFVPPSPPRAPPF